MTPQEQNALDTIKSDLSLTYMIRPIYIGWGIYRPIGFNKAGKEDK